MSGLIGIHRFVVRWHRESDRGVPCAKDLAYRMVLEGAIKELTPTKVLYNRSAYRFGCDWDVRHWDGCVPFFAEILAA